jgi:Lon protease-like protein
VTVGLFPLNLVLFPLTQVPLHIFEPRYRELIQESLTDGTEFGINLVEQGHLHQVGCMARVVDVTEQYEDGRMDVVIEGTWRFRLLEVEEGPKPYVVGHVERVDDEPMPIDPTLVADCTNLHNQIVDLVYGNAEHRVDPEELGDLSPSFLIAPKAGLASDQKQTLLEMTSENARLELLREHLAMMVPTVRKAEIMQRIIRSDGYSRSIED